MPPLNTVIVESACAIANAVQARALFIYADAVRDYPIPSGMLEGTEIIWVTHAGSTAAPSAEVAAIVCLPSIPLTRMGQIKLAVVMGLSEGYVALGDKIVCLTGIPAFGTLDCIVMLDIGRERELLIPTHMPHILEHIPSAIFEAILNLAVELASQGREGKPVGTIFVLGDHQKVMQFSRQTIFNPFRGYPEEERNILNPELRETLKEFAALDGAFVLREDGVVLCAGRHLSAALASTVDLPQGLGSRHVAAAGITSVTQAIAVVISESTGDVRIFKDGGIFLEIEKPSR
ncbi:MAG: DNA integrity scanning protein DisA nucleotide-binding domain protein [Candidatus Tectimicrobiota bacterium]